MNKDKSKERASISLSLDWDKIFKKRIQSGFSASSDIAFSQTTIKFCTGSSYTGKWNILGMTSRGTYVYPYGCEYAGNFEDGMFHGKGIVTYPMGQRLSCFWHKGKMISCTFIYVDGAEQNADYCVVPDRRFMIEHREGIQPAGREYLTNQDKARIVPEDCYDTGDGFFSNKNQCILPARDATDFQEVHGADSGVSIKDTSVDGPGGFWVNALTIVPKKKELWIKEHCRKAWDESAGYRPDFYKEWISGRNTELEELEEVYNNEDVSKEIVTETHVKEEPAKGSAVVTPTTTYAGTGRKLLPGSKIDLLFTDSAHFIDMY